MELGGGLNLTRQEFSGAGEIFASFPTRPLNSRVVWTDQNLTANPFDRSWPEAERPLFGKPNSEVDLPVPAALNVPGA